MDWNWFFSSFAQSSAAIVGIFGAFLITKILNNQALFSQKNSRAKEVIIECKRVMGLSKNRHFSWYNKYKNEKEYEKLMEMLKEGTDFSAAKFYSELNFSIFSPKDDIVKNIENKIYEYKEVKRKREEAFKARAAAYMAKNPGYAYAEGVHEEFKPPINTELIKNLNKERELIDNALVDVNHHISIAKNMINEISGNPECSILIKKMLVFVGLLFFLGVIYPLSFLPTNVGRDITLSFDFHVIMSHMFSIKGIFRTLLSIIFSSILITFFLLNIKLKYSNELISELMECKKLSSYSEYFAIMEENEQKNRKNSESHISQE